MLSVSLKRHQLGSIADEFRSAVPNVFGSALTLVTFVSVVVVVACFNSWDYFFFTLFKNFQS